MISHHNIMCHSADIKVAWKYGEAQSAITWMPYFHDYGLVDGIILPLFANIPSYIMSPFIVDNEEQLVILAELEKNQMIHKLLFKQFVKLYLNIMSCSLTPLCY